MSIAFIVVGKILIWAISWSPVFDKARRVTLINELLSCDFCLGTWVYTILALIFGYSLTPNKGNTAKVLGCALTGVSTSFLMHLASIGWGERFGDAVHSKT